jgi:hypothetical protein
MHLRITNVKVDHVVVAIAVTWTDYAQAVSTATSVASVNNAIQDTHFVDILVKVIGYIRRFVMGTYTGIIYCIFMDLVYFDVCLI